MKIFLSAVSSEFAGCRDALASDLRAVGAEVVVQREFQQHGATLLEKLETYIDGCDRVIALVGTACGWEPDAAALPAGTPRRSYTHWEYAFAQGERLDGRRLPGKDTFVYFASRDFPRTSPIEQSPDCAALQQAFVASFRAHDKDHSTFGSIDELRALVLRDGFHLGGVTAQPDLSLDLFDLTEGNRFFYGARRTPIVGRDEALNALTDFLRADARFAWWLMYGPAGVGKSRTVLECCLRARRGEPAWQAGWLTEVGEFTEWRTWQPKGPTLIVVDDAATAVESARQMILALFRRSDTLARPVRVLLLERDPSEGWRHRLAGAGAERHGLDASRYGPPLELRGLQGEHLWSIVRTIVEQERGGELPDRDRTVAALERIDALKRPLFASFVADALVAGRDIGQWDQKQLLESLLNDDMRKRWEPAGVTEEDRNLLAVATLAGGLPLDVLKNPPVAARLPTVRAYSPDRYRVMCGRPSDSMLNPLTPSVLGEFFVLEQLRASHSIDPRPSELIEMALALPSTRRMNSMFYGWKRGEESTRVARLRQHLYFVGQCARDFPDHPSLERLRGPSPDPNDNSWGWAVDVANLIEELLSYPGTLDFCNHLHDALFEVAVERATTRTSVPPLRTCTTGIKLALMSVSAGKTAAAAHRHRLMQKTAAYDPGLARFQVASGAYLAKGLVRDRKLTEAHAVFSEASRVWQTLDADDRRAAVPSLIIGAKPLVEESVKADRIDLADARYRDLRMAFDGYVDEGGSLAAYEVEAIRPLMRARIARGELGEARALYEDMRRLTMRYSVPPAASDEAPMEIEAAPVEPDPKPSVAMERSESGSITLTAEWQPSSRSGMGQMFSRLLQTMAFEPLSGQKFEPRATTKKEPPSDLAPKLREHMAARAVELMRAYGANDVQDATEILADLRALYGRHPEEPPLPYLYGQGTYILWRLHLIQGELTLAATACEELRLLALAHADDDPAYVRGFTLAAYGTIRIWHDSGDSGVAKLTRAWHDALLRPDAREAITAEFGLEDADRFYVLLAQDSSGAPPAASGR